MAHIAPSAPRRVDHTTSSSRLSPLAGGPSDPRRCQFRSTKPRSIGVAWLHDPKARSCPPLHDALAHRVWTGRLRQGLHAARGRPRAARTSHVPAIGGRHHPRGEAAARDRAPRIARDPPPRRLRRVQRGAGAPLRRRERARTRGRARSRCRASSSAAWGSRAVSPPPRSPRASKPSRSRRARRRSRTRSRRTWTGKTGVIVAGVVTGVVVVGAVVGTLLLAGGDDDEDHKHKLDLGVGGAGGSATPSAPSRPRARTSRPRTPSPRASTGRAPSARPAQPGEGGSAGGSAREHVEEAPRGTRPRSSCSCPPWRAPPFALLAIDLDLDEVADALVERAGGRHEIVHRLAHALVCQVPIERVDHPRQAAPRRSPRRPGGSAPRAWPRCRRPVTYVLRDEPALSDLR